MAGFDLDLLEQTEKRSEQSRSFLFLAPAPTNVPIRCVIFDLFGTLAHMTKTRLPWTHLFGKVAETVVDIEFDTRAASNFVQTTDGPPRLVATQAILNQLPAFDMERLEQLLLEVTFEEGIRVEANSVELFDDSLETILRLRNHGLKLGLVSNLATPYAAALDLCGIRDLFDVVVFSFAEGAMKGLGDDSRIYDCAAQRLNVSKAECLFVGDTVDADYDGPISAGMQAVHLHRRPKRSKSNSTTRPTITTLSQLLVAE